ncbi:MAG TPA: penicillin-binding transpeptidase domain-containing protein [Pyrinomonadaceae bacterium]|jgi:beta-lactamase class D|nr:penicillin-binding transpeptidase domain-containing protein [Pyrinomonadaceae bacterium]
MNLIKLFLLVTLLLAGCAGAGRNRVVVAGQQPQQQQQPPQDLDSYFKETEGCFVLYDLKRDHYTRYNEARCRERFNPKSTFKIPNSLIGLETGVIRDADFLIPWDKQKYPPDGWDTEPFIQWKRDHTLRTAFQNSVVWYYRELAQRVGAERMKKYVTAFNYGDRNISGPIDYFWLNNTLKISADEQVEFLKKFYLYKLAVARRSVDIVREIMVREQTPGYRLSGKTGGGALESGRFIGWFVGYVETGGDTYFFATNIEGPTYLSIRDKRIDLTKQILSGLNVLPKQ